MKQNINEIKRMQRNAGLITESEYQEAIKETEKEEEQFGGVNEMDTEEVVEASDDLTYNFSHRVSDEAYRRMDGLVSQPELFNFISAASKIMDDLSNEGFDTKDIYYYLFTRLTADV